MALITAPNGGDPYHLERVIYWTQHHNVDYYDTCVMRQLFSPVFAEYVNLNIFLITGGDLTANMAQNVSSYGCLILLYGLIRKLGCGIKWALFGCVLALTMNIFCIESISTTSVDMVSAFQLMVLTYMMIEVLYDDSKLTIFQFVLLGLVSGFLYITKTNACAPGAVIVIGVAIMKLFQGKLKILPLGIVSLIFIAALIAPTFYRNYQAFDGDVLARLNVNRIAIGTASPRYVLMNVMKNLCTIGVERNSILLRGFMKTVARVLNVDINATEIGGQFALQYFLDMTTAGAHLVTPLFLAATLASLFYVAKHRTKTEGLMLALILQMYAILIILRWQFSSRLILPSLVVAVIPIVYYFRAITSSFSTTSWQQKACRFLVLYFVFEGGVCSLESLGFHGYVALGSWSYPRYGRYFGIGQNLKGFGVYNDFARLIDEGDYDNIGLDGTEGMGQYPILAKYVPQGKRVECVRLQGNGRDVEAMSPSFVPDVIIVADVELDPEKIYTCNGNEYRCIYNFAERETDYTHTNIFYRYSAWAKR